MVSACPKGSTVLGLHLSQCLSADQFQVDFETKRFAACWSLDYQWCCDKVPAAIALFLLPPYLGQATVTYLVCHHFLAQLRYMFLQSNFGFQTADIQFPSIPFISHNRLSPGILASYDALW